MKRSAMLDSMVFLLLVVAGATVRIAIDVPNFAPVAAIALFAGYYFPSRVVAAMIPLAIMAISDAVLGPYRLSLMAVVYAMLALPVLPGHWLAGCLSISTSGSLKKAFGTTALLVGSSLAASVAFFLVTNFACWWGAKAYSQDFAGVLHCYAQALPFFRNTLLGDLSFSLLLFGGYGLLMQRSVINSPILARESVRA